jgi:hypothetical protein
MWHKPQTYAAGVAVLLLGSACTGQREVAMQVPTEAPAHTARFVGISDAVPLKFFDANTSAPDPLDPSSLVIGFDTGSDPTTLIARDFRASALPFSHRAAMDTISFTIEAPACYFISKVIYTQQGIGSTGRTSVSAGGATWVVAGVPGNLGVFSDDPSLSGTVDLTSLRLTSVPVSITVSLFASTGSVAVTGAGVHVELLPLTPDCIAP